MSTVHWVHWAVQSNLRSISTLWAAHHRVSCAHVPSIHHLYWVCFAAIAQCWMNKSTQQPWVTRHEHRARRQWTSWPKPCSMDNTEKADTGCMYWDENWSRSKAMWRDATCLLYGTNSYVNCITCDKIAHATNRLKRAQTHQWSMTLWRHVSACCISKIATGSATDMAGVFACSKYLAACQSFKSPAGSVVLNICFDYLLAVLMKHSREQCCFDLQVG